MHWVVVDLQGFGVFGVSAMAMACSSPSYRGDSQPLNTPNPVNQNKATLRVDHPSPKPKPMSEGQGTRRKTC